MLWTNVTTSIPNNFPVFYGSLKATTELFELWRHHLSSKPQTEMASAKELIDNIFIVIPKHRYFDPNFGFGDLCGCDLEFVNMLLSRNFIDVHLSTASTSRLPEGQRKSILAYQSAVTMTK
jgi:hypothetical protein